MPINREQEDGRQTPDEQMGRRAAPELRLTGLPPNKLGEEHPLDNSLIQILRRNQEALSYSITGDELEADLAEVGHKHEKQTNRLLWRSHGSWILPTSFDTDNQEGHVVDTTAMTDFALIPLHIGRDGTGAGAVNINPVLVPRYRISNPSAGSAAYTTLTISGSWWRYPSGGGALITLPTAPEGSVLTRVESVAGRTWVDAWIEGPAVEIPAYDMDLTEGDLFLLLAAQITTGGDKATIWEIEVGQYDPRSMGGR
jgi:hypothetical protein